MRFASIFVPHFAVQAALRCEPEGNANRKRPMVILDGPDSVLRVFAFNERAACRYIAVGMTRIQAEQCPGVVLCKRLVAQEQAAQFALVDCALAFSPRVESATEGAVTCEIAGTNRVFGPPKTLAQRIVQTCTEMGFEVNVAVATNPDAALVGAKGLAGITIIPSGEEQRCLSKLPIEVLSPMIDDSEILDSWGIRTCSDLVALPPIALVERLGQEGLRLHTLARGAVQRKLLTLDPPNKFEEHLELEDSVTDLESLAFLLNRLLHQVAARLTARGFATDEIRLCLDLEEHSDRDVRDEVEPRRSMKFERTLKSAVPIDDTKTLLKLLQLDLAAHNPGAPVRAITLEAMPAKRRSTQGGLFTPRAPEPASLEVTLARIRAVVGEMDEQGRHRVGAPQICDSHKPDDFQVVPFRADNGKPNPSRFSRDTGVALRIFRPPFTAKVRSNQGKPAHITFAECSAPIVCAAGPWFRSGLWWHETQCWSREDWDIAIRSKDGVGLYRIYHQGHHWFVEGLYD